MFGKKSTIKKYIRHLSPELEKRYEKKGPYTQNQVRETVNALGLSEKNINYAYLIYCDQKTVIRENNIPQDQAKSMCNQIEYIVGGGE